MRNRIFGAVDWGHAVAVLLTAGVFSTVLADARLDDLKTRKAELDRLAAECSVMQDPGKAQCLANRQKKVEKYKADLEAYKSDLSKESPAEDEDYKNEIAAREKSIREFTDFLATCVGDTSERCASALFQAATLSYEKEEYVFLAEQAKYESEYQRWEDRDHQGIEPVAPRRNHVNSMQLFQRFIKEFPNNKQIPDALVGAYRVADMLGNDALTFQYLNELVTRFPDNPQSIKAHLRLGEYWFLKRDYEKAIEQYAAVPLDYPGPEAGLALYHRAESYYNMANFDEAAHWYYEYVTRADAGKIQGDLRDEAMSFMAASWADMDNGFDTASHFLAEHGNPSWEKDVYYQIGQKNKSHDRLDESLKAFRFLLERDPNYPEAPEADLAIIEILILQKKAEDAQTARVAFVKRYAEDSEWYRKNAGNKDAIDKAQKAVHMALYQIPVYYHRKSDEGDTSTELLRMAEQGYRDYLNHFPSEISWDVYQVHQHLAVLYDKLKAYQKSAVEWRWCAEADTVKMGKLPSDKKNLVAQPDAGYNAVLEMDQARIAALKDVYHNDTAAAYKGPETRAYLDDVDWFSGTFGHYASLAELAYNAAILHYEARQYDASVKSLSGLIEKFPDHPRAVLIRRALAQSLLESGQYDDAARQFVILQSKLCPFDSQCAEIKKSLASTMFKQAETQEKSHDYAAATQKYQQLAREYRDVEFADKALFEAGVNADSSGHPEDGARLLLRIPQDFPNSILRVKAMLKAASIYMDIKKYRDAADVFLRLQMNFPNDSLAGIQALAWAADAYQKAQDDRRAGQTYESAYRLYPVNPKTPEYMYNAGQIYESLKSYGDAIVVYRLIAVNYPSSQFAEDAMFSIPLLLDKQGDRENAAKAYHDFAMKYSGDKAKAIQAFFSAGKDYEGLGDEKEAMDEYGKCIELQSGSGLPPALAAEAAYRIGDMYYRKVASVRLDGTKSQNDGRLKTMQENLIPSIQAFAKAVELAEEEWALRATLRMGDLFSTIALISDNQRVAGLSGEDRIRVNIAAKSSVPNYIDKAKELYKKNLDIGLSQKLQSPWIDTSGMRLMEAYALKGRALEDLAQLFLNIPLPEGADPEDLKAARLQLKQASDEQKTKAIDNYREAISMAQTYHLDNPGLGRIETKLRELAPDSTGTQNQMPPSPSLSAPRPDTSETSGSQHK